MTIHQKFEKPPLGRQKLIDLMKARGLPLESREDQSRAREAITRIGYYRLSGYMPVFQYGGDGKNKHDFLPNTSFENILDLYNFDTDLRAHLSVALETIEVAFRTSVCDHMCRRTQDSHWILDPQNFKLGTHAQNLKVFSEAILEQNQQSEFLVSYFSKYNDPFQPPSWMMRECASFGSWSRLYSDLHAADQKSISDDWLYPNVRNERIDHVLLAKWIRTLVILRNTAAHHSRVTNKKFTFRAEASTHHSVSHLFRPETNDLRTLIVLIAILLKTIQPNSIWLKQLFLLFDVYDRSVNVAHAAGFDRVWTTDVLWDF